MRTSASRALALLILAIPLMAGGPAAATQVKAFRIQSRTAFLKGTLDGVSVDALGRLKLADRVERVATVAEPFLLSAAVSPEGWVVGTGNDGRVLQVDRKGEVTELFAAPEPEVFAVWVDPDGTIFAGTSPRGKVYRIPPGGAGEGGAKAEVYFDPGQTYIWDLARAADGSLLVATGTEGKLFRVRSAGASADASLLYDSDDAHMRRLEPLPDGSVLVGTAGEGLILRIAPDGSARTLYDADQPEVVALATAPDGTSYAALVASEASFVDLTHPAGGASEEKKETKGKEEGHAEVSVVTATAGAGSRRPGASGPRSVIVRIDPSGLVEPIWKSDDETVYALLWERGRLWVGTGLEGKLYSYSDGEMVLEKDVDDRQIVALMKGRPGPAFATTNAAALYRVAGGTERQGTYTSAALDAGEISRFGSFRWRGETPSESGVRFSFRSGVSSEPDKTWSPWTKAEKGRELSLAVPVGRFVQWRAALEASDGTSPVLSAVALSYLQENLEPKIDRLRVLDPGQILVPANFNPTNQVFEPAHPNRDGIFTTLDTSGASEDVRLKPLWKQGYRTLRWKVEDPNGDDLVYALAFQLAGSDAWMPMTHDLEESYYSFDATALPDGLYRFRLEASDRPSNPAEGARMTEQVSEPVVVDHTPPVLRDVRAKGGTLEAVVEDAWSPLREAEVSFDAGEWKPVETADGLLDGQRETLLLEVPKGTHLVLLRVTDAAFNVVTFNLTGKQP